MSPKSVFSAAGSGAETPLLARGAHAARVMPVGALAPSA